VLRMASSKKPPAALIRRLIKLAAVRHVLAETQAREKLLHADAIKAMRAADLSQVDLTPGHRALLEWPETATIDPAVFTNACIQLRVPGDQAASAMRRSVDLRAARNLLKPSQFDGIATYKREKPRIRIVGTRGRK